MFRRSGSWRPEASICASAVLTRRPGLGRLLALWAPRGADLSPTVSCPDLSFVESGTACSLNKQIPRCEPIRHCHVFPDEIPDLVCCVFLKTRPLPPKTSAGEEKHFSLNYCFLKWCQIMPHFRGLDTPLFPLTAFVGKAVRWQSVARREARLGIIQMGRLRPREAEGGAMPGVGLRASARPRSPDSWPVFLLYLYPPDVLSLA